MLGMVQTHLILPTTYELLLSLFFKKDHSGSERLGEWSRSPKWEMSADIHIQVGLAPTS